MIDLATTYLGMALRNPLVCSSSPLCENIERLQEMEEAGAAAIVLHSLFEEQIDIDSFDLYRFLDNGTESYAESISYFPDMRRYNLGPEGYLEHIRHAKKALAIPVIGSLNGVTTGGWTRYARMIADAGADALELNLYHLPTSPTQTAADIEDEFAELVSSIKATIHIPLAVKLSPFFTAPVAFVKRLEEAGANGVVLFNRFYQPDFDLESLDVTPTMHLSTPGELLLRLHWTAILFGRVNLDLAITGGVHSATDVLKVMMAGGRVAMMTSVLLKCGIDHLRTIREDLVAWMGRHEYDSMRMMQGSMSFNHVANPSVYERANYMKVLRAYAIKK
jgi:dihydroorotate dehydrogenase (fumarate)